MGGDGPGRQYEFIYPNMISVRTFEIIKCVENNIDKCNEIDDDKIFMSFSELVSYIKDLYNVCRQVDENCTHLRNSLDYHKWNYEFDPKHDLSDIRNMLNKHRQFMVESRTKILDLEAYIYSLACNLKDCCPFMEFDDNADIRNPLACERIWEDALKGKHIYASMMDDKSLTCDELWEKANTDEPITCEDLGIEKKSKDGLTHYYDGVMVYHKGKKKVVPWKKFKKIIKSIFK